MTKLGIGPTMLAPEGWQPGFPLVEVEDEVVRTLGMPEVDYAGIDALYRQDLQMDHLPVTAFKRIITDLSFSRQLAHYDILSRTISIDPILMAEAEDSALEITQQLACMGTVAAYTARYPFRSQLPGGHRFVRKQAEQAKWIPGLLSRYGELIRFPNYNSDYNGLARQSKPVL